MNVGPYTFEEFKEKARAFHGYPAPGLLVGGYMVELAKRQMAEGVLYEAVVETGKCLPDAVQLLTVLSIGNGWMRILNLGRYALTLHDKRTGEGVRVWLDTDKLAAWPNIRAWIFKETEKKDQDTPALFTEIEAAGDTICSMAPVQVSDALLGKSSMGVIAPCPVCNEAYPIRDGAICRGCQGEAPYVGFGTNIPLPLPVKAIPVTEAVGKKAVHDMTRIAPGEFKGVEVSAGQTIGAGDLCRLQQMGRAHVYVEDELPVTDEWVHENEAVRAFAKRMVGEGVAHDEEPHEGKLDFTATRKGLLVIDRARLEAFNLVPGVMCATRRGDMIVPEGKKFAGTRAIPLFLSREDFSRALAALGEGPLFRVVELPRTKVGVLVTGTEVFKGLIEDKFEPVVRAKVESLGSEVVAAEIRPDDRAAIVDGVSKLLDAGAELIVTTAGLSVDPDDVTRQGLLDAGLTDVVHGGPILPGAMTLVGRLGKKGGIPLLGVPACALFYKTTSLDLLLPRLLAGQRITRKDMATYAEGGYCLTCKACTFPKCPFGK